MKRFLKLTITVLVLIELVTKIVQKSRKNAKNKIMKLNDAIFEEKNFSNKNRILEKKFFFMYLALFSFKRNLLKHRQDAQNKIKLRAKAIEISGLK